MSSAHAHPATNASQAIALLSHVTLHYESGAQALNDVSLTVAAGEHVCILGANGSGKSTLASVLCGLLAPDAGNVSLVGEDVFDASRNNPIDFEAYRRARRSLGLVFQNPDDQIVTTVVEEDVAFGPENLGVPPTEIDVRVRRELQRVALTAYAKANPTRLSGGQKQRVAIAGTLAMEPRMLVLDEPGALLDVRGRSAIMRVMGRLRNTGTTIVHITHFMDEALAADRVLVMDNGRIVLEGTPKAVFSQAARIAALGLEEPFVAQLSQRLGLPWTDDVQEVAQRLMHRRPAQRRPAGEPIAQGGSPTVRGGSSHVAAVPPAIQVDGVSFSYQRSRKALDDVSLTVPQGAYTAIVGQTGSGKSTLLRLICALEAPDSGAVTVNGVCTTRKRDRRRLQGTIGYVMQHPERQLFAETVYEDVAFGPRNLGLSATEVERRCKHALTLVGLTDLNDASPFELSGGQQRLCALAGILAMEPKTLVLDEPTAGLDPRGRQELRKILANVHGHGVTVIQVTHSMEDAVRADQVIVLNESQVMLHGTPREVFQPQHDDLLKNAGLGLPAALQTALALQDYGAPHLGNPLVLDSLVEAIQQSVGTPRTQRHAGEVR